jgi:hypothetical protein
MKTEELQRVLDQIAPRELPRDAGLSALKRMEDTLLRDLRPAPPLQPAWVFLLGFMVLSALAAVLSGMVLGMGGLHALGRTQRLLIFPSLLLAAWVAAAGCVRAMRPASGAGLGGLALALALAGFPVLFAAIFHGYSILNLVPEGVPCLAAGLGVAVPVGFLAAILLRRGFVLAWSRAGLASGVLAGLSGLCMLELHCPNLKAIHVLVWHVAVIACGAALGGFAGRIADGFRRHAQS